jgi:asparagine synthase (glutamine-hydrolysing)
LSGIAGVFTFDGGPAAASEVEQMAAASQRPRLAPLVSSSQITVWFDGRLDNREELARLAPPAGADPARTSDTQFVLAAYERFGDRFVSQLNGDFALALVDEHRRQLILARDVMAAVPLYYCSLPGALLFASEIQSLLANPRVTPSLNEDALAALVLDFWCDEHQTCFKHIQSVPPGHALVVTRERLELREHWTFDPSRQVRYGSFDDYRDHFRFLFEQAVRRRLRSAHPVGVMVSGGVDSSSIFCLAEQLVRAEAMPVTLQGLSMTFAKGSPADEHDLLNEVERACETPITRIPITEYRYFDNADAVVRQFETPGVVCSAQDQVWEAARRAGCRVLLSGFFGDQMLASRGYLVDLARRGRWLTIRRDLREVAAWMTDATPGVFGRECWSRIVRGMPPRWLFRLVKRFVAPSRAKTLYPPWFTAAFRRRALDMSSARFEAPGHFASAHTEEYYRHAAAGHYINAVRCDRAGAEMHGIDVRYPFRDRDLVAFLMAIPGEIVNWQGIPKGLLRQALTDVLPAAVRDRRWKADFTALENRAMRQGRDNVARLLSPDCLAVRCEIVDAALLDDAMRTFATYGDDDDAALPGWRPTDLISLELWLRNFVDASERAV